MEFFTKCLFFIVLIAATYSRSIELEGNTFDKSENSNCSCDWRYYKHYETKNCVVESVDSCGCPQKFTCPSNQTQQTPAKVCIYQNKEYKVGSKIVTSNICEVCRCRDGVPPSISCIVKECPLVLDAPGEDCHLIYKDNKCCPVGLECLVNESETSAETIRNETCQYNGRLYPFGSKIYPVDDPCQTCICDKNWSGVDNSSCYQQDCILEKNKSKLDKGCIPVYHESRCCPIEFYCPTNHNSSYSPFTNDESFNNSNSSSDNQCYFDGQFYELGKKLFINNSCIKCSCDVPPVFTCIHQKCPPSPSENICFRVYNPGECCPSYECMIGDAAQPLSDGCPTPLCADSSCRIETLPGHECPTCVCNDNISELEHNNLEQVQQISQNMEQIGQVQQVFEPMANDYLDDELQMMPLRIQDSEERFPILEKVILPEIELDEYADGLRELDESSIEDNSSIDAVNTVSEEIALAERNSTLMPESDLNDTNPESVSNQSEKVVQKRSGVFGAVVPVEQQEVSQEAMQGFNEDIEREGVDLEGNGENFDDELESFKKKMFAKNGTTINEVLAIDHVVKVPPGCPTPLCEGPWCKIGILEGHSCPTCICKRHTDSEP